MTESQRSTRTRQKLLDVATDVFVQRGFHNARVRDVCSRAGTNVAAVNYHFGSKAGLYREVLQHAFFSLAGADPTAWLDPAGTPEEGVHSLVRSLLSQLLHGGKSARFAKLVAREMVDPTDAMEDLIDRGIRPQVDALCVILRDILGKGANDQQVRRCASSILGQCLFYYFARPAIRRARLETRLGRGQVEELAQHITRFSLMAMRGMRGR